MSFLLVGLALQIAAQNPENSRPSISIDRLDLVAEHSKTICAAMLTKQMTPEEDRSLRMAHAKKYGYSRAEYMLMIQLCLAYSRGAKQMLEQDGVIPQ